jgi:hypothetical protein
MTIKPKAADRGEGQAVSKTSCECLNDTNTFRSSLDRLPVPMRRRYLAACRAADIASRYMAEVRRLLQETQP